MAKNKLTTMVIGGASSGKSSFAERIVIGQDAPHFYMATAQAYDDEMRKKILEHQRDRQDDGWTTVEVPLDLISAFGAIPDDASILLDCATMWLSNLLMADHETDDEIDRLVAFIARAPQNITVVTNEVGLGIVPENKLARQFRIAQGAFNAKLASSCDCVVGVMAGLPFALKGTLP